MSVLFWVFAAKSGVDAYDINSLQGTYDSLEVNACTVGMCVFTSSKTNHPGLLVPGCIFNSVHTSVAIIISEDICLAVI